MPAHREYACVDHVALLEGGADGAVKSVLEEEFAIPFHDVGKEVAEVGRVLIEKVIQIECRLGCDEVVKANLTRRNFRPGTLSEPMIGVGALRVHSFENHYCSLNSDVQLCR